MSQSNEMHMELWAHIWHNDQFGDNYKAILVIQKQVRLTSIGDSTSARVNSEMIVNCHE